VLAGCALAWPAVARGADATTAEVRSLAAAALRDPSAVQRLRAIDRVDGRPVRLADALGGSPAELRPRLRLLAGEGGGGSPAQSPDARKAARDVLSDGRYRDRSLPRPLRGVFAWIGDRLAPVWRWIEGRFEALAGGLPGGRTALWALLAGSVLAATAMLAIRAASRRQSAVAGSVAAARTGERAGPARLLAEAARAEARGDRDEALRLRFRAGLLDLDRRELIELRPALTNRELLGAVPSPTLGGLVTGFESVAYGGRCADDEDLLLAREGWPRVPAEATER